MVFNGETNNQDLTTLMDSELGTDDTTFPLERKALFASKALSMIWKRIWKSYGGFQYVDKNDASDPFTDVTGTASTNKIAIPTAAESITGIAYLDTGVTEYKPLKPITEEEINRRGYTIHNFMKTAGVPEFYVPKGLNFYVFPAFVTTTAAGFRVYHDRKSSAFTPSDTTREPGFVSDFHPAIATGAAYFEARRARLPMQSDLKDEWTTWLDEIGEFYRKRYKEQKAAVVQSQDYSQGMR